MTIDDFKDAIDLDNVNRVAIDRFAAMIAEQTSTILGDNGVIRFMLVYYSLRAVGKRGHDEAFIAAFMSAKLDPIELDDAGREMGEW